MVGLSSMTRTFSPGIVRACQERPVFASARRVVYDHPVMKRRDPTFYYILAFAALVVVLAFLQSGGGSQPAYQVRSIPKLVLVSPDGVVRRVYSSASEGRLVRDVEELLSGSGSPPA